MGSSLNLLAFDLGSSSGRSILGSFDGEKISLKEIYRFPNAPLKVNGMLYWDILNIYQNMLQGFAKFKDLNAGALSCFGIDAWGNDYGLLDKNMQLISNARSARHTTLEDMEAVHELVPGLELYWHTGLADYSINTLYQIYRRMREGDPAIENAHAMLMIPDLLAFFCTGELHSEYTISTTTMMYNPSVRGWDIELLSRLGIPERILQPVVMPGTLSGTLKQDIAEELGIGQIPYALTGSHDTASAAAAVPVAAGKTNYAFCSSGTWSLIGIETEQPILAEEFYNNRFSNEGTVQGGFRPINNITGMWILQECMKKWRQEGFELTFAELAEAVADLRPYYSIIDVDHPSFFKTGNMPKKVREFCRQTGQRIPETPQETALCIYESLALKYRWAMEWLGKIKDQKIEELYIVGGGAKNKILNQMAADCLGCIVIAGPYEASCMGNLLVQAQALGELSGIDEIRQVVRSSIELETYHPCTDKSSWDEAYAFFLTLLEN